MPFAPPAVRILEEVEVFTPLGVRFWDPVLDRQVRSGLLVRAWAAAGGAGPGRSRVATAFRTLSDVYAFQDLPGLRSLERPAAGPPPGPTAEPASPPAPRPRFVVEVRDLEHRFVDSAFEVELPLPRPGPFPAAAEASPPDEPGPALPGLHLFSSPSRQSDPALARMRAELVDRATGLPAAHALAELRVPGERSWQGVADGAGRLALPFPVPDLVEGFGGSPESPGARPLHERTWPVTLEVRYSPGDLRKLPGTGVPDLASILNQRPARLWANRPDDDAGVAELPGELVYGRDLTFRTEGLPSLVIAPTET